MLSLSLTAQKFFTAKMREEAMVPDPFDMYVSQIQGEARATVKKYQEAGCTHVALGTGSWVGDEKVVRVLAFYHSSGQIVLEVDWKLMDSSLGTRQGPHETFLFKTSDEAGEFFLRWEVKLGEKTMITSEALLY